MIYGDIWWYLVISGDMWWYIMIYHDSWHMMIYDEKKWTKVDKNYCSQVDCHTFHGFLWLLREQNPDWYCSGEEKCREWSTCWHSFPYNSSGLKQTLFFGKLFLHLKLTVFMLLQAPSILVNTELAIDENIGGFSKEVRITQDKKWIQPKNLSNLQLAKLETAVKTMHSVANDQAAKYRGEMKKVPCKILNPQRALAKIDNHGWIE